MTTAYQLAPVNTTLDLEHTDPHPWMDYNGTPGRSEDGCLTAGACPRGTRTYDQQAPGGSYADCTARHAEANAIGQALMHGQAARLYRATIAVTRTPCDQCAGLIRQWDIVRVVTPEAAA